MHLRSRLLPRSSASSPLDNRAHPMANTSQAPDLEGLYCEIHNMVEQMKIMNENNTRLIQHLTTNHQPPLAAFAPDVVDRTRRTKRLGDSESQSHQSIGRARQNRTPIPPPRSTTQKIRDLDARIDAMNTGVGVLVIVEALIRQIEPPFMDRVMRTRVSSKFKLPTQLGVYEGKTDPMDHLDLYKSLMSLQ
ncbi:hypothetical protein Acr_05g0000260 [Actinidia rufa]|uniref:Uncharacterized protein n=1 Tax=Actinidia rufa TaxID=165716 RepID=A0A7J0EL84_9ERIC|nr:hypothetical protein Acr_05g0000260 [Actinidia rufa]